MGRVEGKTAIVTGGGGGIGSVSAVTLAREGAAVAVVDVDGDRATQVVQGIEAAGGTAVAVQADVSVEAEVEHLVRTTVASLGRLDVLHNNAGVHETGFTSQAQSTELPEEVWDKVIAINLKGPWMCSKYAAPLLKDAGGGVIVNAASIGGLVGYPMAAAYCSSKGGVLMLTKQAAIDLAPEIRVNCYCPASIDTPMVAKYYEAAEDREAIDRALTGTHLLPRLGKPEEVASLVCFLASDASSFLTGSAITIDGGSLAWRGSR